MPYSMISILYNPVSTGNSRALAEKFKADVIARMPKQKIEIISTEYAGHDEELAYTLSKETKHPLIVVSSGDGGYHNIINGVLRAQKEGAKPVAGLLPAGNANDHYRNLHDKDIIDAIEKGQDRKIDVLKLTGTRKGEPYERYSHSYIGFGLTPVVGLELNRNKLNPFNQVWIVAKALLNFKTVKLVIDNVARRYDSVIFSNVDTMSKVLKISQPSHINDGKFEVTIFRRKNRLQLISQLLRASTFGVKEDHQTKKFALKTVRKALVQLDGEVTSLDPHTDVLITIEHKKLSCII